MRQAAAQLFELSLAKLDSNDHCPPAAESRNPVIIECDRYPITQKLQGLDPAIARMILVAQLDLVASEAELRIESAGLPLALKEDISLRVEFGIGETDEPVFAIFLDGYVVRGEVALHRGSA